MAVLSRREFGTIVIAGAPLAAVRRSRPLAPAPAVAVGVSTAIVRTLPRVTGRDNVDAVITALRAVGATHIELAMANVEPAPPDTGPMKGGTPAYPRLIVFTPEQIAAARAAARTDLRSWRASADAGFFEQVRGKLAAAGLTVHACAVSFDASFTDDEIDATLRQIKALGATTVSSPMTLATAARLVPFADRHQVTIAIHNQVDGNAAGEIATPQLQEALALSSRYRLKLDIGNLTAANCDAVAELRQLQTRVSHVLVRDRLQHGGASQPLGEGDTPIAGVLGLLKASAAPVPALVEYDYVGLHSAVEEITASLAYMAAALDSARG
jgi:sugar phosphate isomerase/epimerase